ncbi:SH3 domain-containing protein [Jannaschia donghaensis]|uniref:SH3b domain-containing protein n=1 Tax=Jannaschia donghaensis TaxID=420998 RepID=A0A0M6YGZ7_9RHOB|nr:SH3 domain-containing protein [Jannaschia donghaensis]CTQ49622.1 hypothetical protein JDO7802_01636 [Jannaschia donghaensis]
MRLLPILLTLAVTLMVLPAVADPLRNTSQFGVDMRAGPGLQFPLIHVLDPGEVADRGRCDLDGKWCLLTARNKIGWVDTFGLAPPRATGASDLSRSDPITPLRTAPIESTTLDGGPVGTRPLPGAITDAVRGMIGGVPPAPPGARVPFMFATNAPFYNVTAGPVNLRAGPGTENPVVGLLDPGQGGVIDVCDAAQRWCRISVQGGPVAWVKMTLVGLRRIDVPPLAASDRAR